VFFRAPDLGHAVGYLAAIWRGLLEAPMAPTPAQPVVLTLVLSGILLACDWWLRRDERELRVPTGPWRHLAYVVLLTAIALFFGKTSSFIYFQF